jgi:hypothetical protein
MNNDTYEFYIQGNLINKNIQDLSFLHEHNRDKNIVQMLINGDLYSGDAQLLKEFKQDLELMGSIKSESTLKNYRRQLNTYCHVCGKKNKTRGKHSTCRRKLAKINIFLTVGNKCAICSRQHKDFNILLSSTQFHHLDPCIKYKNISEMWQCETDALDNELRKCIPLCHTCHNEVEKGRPEPKEVAKIFHKFWLNINKGKKEDPIPKFSPFNPNYSTHMIMNYKDTHKYILKWKKKRTKEFKSYSDIQRFTCIPQSLFINKFDKREIKLFKKYIDEFETELYNKYLIAFDV